MPGYENTINVNINTKQAKKQENKNNYPMVIFQVCPLPNEGGCREEVKKGRMEGEGGGGKVDSDIL